MLLLALLIQTRDTLYMYVAKSLQAAWAQSKDEFLSTIEAVIFPILANMLNIDLIRLPVKQFTLCAFQYLLVKAVEHA